MCSKNSGSYGAVRFVATCQLGHTPRALQRNSTSVTFNTVTSSRKMAVLLL